VTRFVATPAVRQAVRGRETDVLDKLGIDWRAGRPHIDCPYPQHGGKSDWRWDEAKAKAFCTCVSRPDSIFDVAAKLKSIDFENAKVFVAEAIGRAGLIRENSGTVRQATDAASLLNAPAKCRDDTLAINYLGYRVGMDPQAAPKPKTPMVGLKALGYYEPPARGSKAKPKLIGEHPCAVFGTVAADGGRHAHRIYLAPGGAGKADLGTGPNGNPRDPKKSARVLGDDNTAGRAVLWGDPKIAPHIVVTEGIETGCAVALALQDEIVAGKIAVAAGITAGGVEAFQVYSATKRVTLAADRDEAEKNGKPGSRRGERAARAFGIGNFKAVTVDIALPGSPGQAVDWLDVLLRDGIEAVRAGILAATAFVPTRQEFDSAGEAQRRATELEEIARQYPLPKMETLLLQYAHTANGEIKIHKTVEEKGEPKLIPVLTPIGVSARLRFLDQTDAYGLRCVVQDMNGKLRAIDFDRGALPRMAASDIRSSLFSAGLRTEADGEIIAVQILKAADPSREIATVRRPGWHMIAGFPDPIFIAPSGLVITDQPAADFELTINARISARAAIGGTPQGWRNAITAAVAVDGCPHWKIGAAAGFAGPLIDLLEINTCGINLSGMSSSGKTLAQRLAASAWSIPAIRDDGLFQSALTTPNAAETLAHRSNGTLLPLDELGLVSGKELARLIYMLSGGAGKRRMTADAQMQGGYLWATFVILSGECSLEEKVRGDAGTWLAGMATRITDVDVTTVDRNVDALTLRAIGGVQRHYGHAGPAFVQKLIEGGLHRQPEELNERIVRATLELAGEDAGAAMPRAATPLAVTWIAGELAKNFDLLPSEMDIKEAIKWAWRQFAGSSDAAPLNPDEQVVAALRTWIAERWAVTIKHVDAEGGINNRETVAWFDDRAVYIPKTRLREAAGYTLNEAQIASILGRLDLLARKPEPDRYYIRWIPKVGPVTAYALRRENFGREANFTVRPGGRDD
jgi:phage/plasmid primase-like uncharacterized protein